jgi:hypothetical protein
MIEMHWELIDDHLEYGFCSTDWSLIINYWWLIIEWLNDWMIEWLAIWMTVWLDESKLKWLIDWLTDWLTNWLTD